MACRFLIHQIVRWINKWMKSTINNFQWNLMIKINVKNQPWLNRSSHALNAKQYSHHRANRIPKRSTRSWFRTRKLQMKRNKCFWKTSTLYGFVNFVLLMFLFPKITMYLIQKIHAFLSRKQRKRKRKMAWRKKMTIRTRFWSFVLISAAAWIRKFTEIRDWVQSSKQSLTKSIEWTSKNKSLKSVW